MEVESLLVDRFGRIWDIGSYSSMKPSNDLYISAYRSINSNERISKSNFAWCPFSSPANMANKLGRPGSISPAFFSRKRRDEPMRSISGMKRFPGMDSASEYEEGQRIRSDCTIKLTASGMNRFDSSSYCQQYGQMRSWEYRED